ncbi:MAG: type II toxin-antitoxin system VapC family toxin [Armatimonadetes bacterium]|nr:type II toxin-antitoxin system VapC family toxin [Armatimonadota bacterium]
MTSEICVDANLAVMWYTPEAGRELAVELLHECMQRNIRIIAPDFIYGEAGSAIRRKVYRGSMDEDEGRVSLSLLLDAQIDCANTLDLFDEAWRIACRYNLATLYDAFYLALAELRGCDFWTADKRFINSVSSIPYVKNITDFAPGILKR